MTEPVFDKGLSPYEEALIVVGVIIVFIVVMACCLYAGVEAMTAPRNYIYYGAPND